MPGRTLSSFVLLFFPFVAISTEERSRDAQEEIADTCQTTTRFVAKRVTATIESNFAP